MLVEEGGLDTMLVAYSIKLHKQLKEFGSQSLFIKLFPLINSMLL